MEFDGVVADREHFQNDLAGLIFELADIVAIGVENEFGFFKIDRGNSVGNYFETHDADAVGAVILGVVFVGHLNEFHASCIEFDIPHFEGGDFDGGGLEDTDEVLKVHDARGFTYVDALVEDIGSAEPGIEHTGDIASVDFAIHNDSAFHNFKGPLGSGLQSGFCGVQY